VLCKCGEIEVDGGDAMKCAARNWDNFLRVDDDGNEIVPVIKNDGEDVKPLYNAENPEGPTKEDLFGMLEEMIKSIERMPQEALTATVTHYDHWALMTILLKILRK
jgi:hypothetical protein